jgi:hypothetical protein
MELVHIRPTHFTYHKEGLPPRFRIQADEATPFVRIEFAARPQLFTPAEQAQRTADNYFDSWAGGNGVAAQQLRLSARKLTYDMPLAVWRAMAQGNQHIYFRVSASTAATPNWSAQPPQTVRSLSDAVAARGWGLYFGVPRDRLQDPWVFTDAAVLDQVPEFYRDKLRLLTRYHETHEAAYLLRRLAGHQNYTSLPADQRVKALTVYAAANNPARRAILQLFERQIPPTASGGAAVPAVRNQDLTTGRSTLLDNLARLVEADPHMNIPEMMDTLVADVIEEIADPSFELNQGSHGTCVPTSVQWVVATYFPSEYVRLMLTLMTQEARASLANGNPAAVPVDTYRYDQREDNPVVRRFLARSWAERIFQATMMNFARPGMNYSNIRDAFVDGRGGLTMDELVRMLNGLRNRTHVRQSGAGANLITTIAQRVQSPTLPVLTMMRWGPANNQGFHEVVSVGATASEITFRNPWGTMNYTVGQAQQNPPRRSTNPARGEETMTRTDMAQWVQEIVIEQN